VAQASLAVPEPGVCDAVVDRAEDDDPCAAAGVDGSGRAVGD
jgi:hypothetical protein